MNKKDFFLQLNTLLSSPVEGMEEEEKHRIIEHFLASTRTHLSSALPQLHSIPFVRGRRPFDEIRYAGYGSSEHVGLLVHPDSPTPHTLYLLYQIKDPKGLLSSPAKGGDYQLRLSLSFCDPNNPEIALPLPHATALPLLPMRFDQDAQGKISLSPVAMDEAAHRSLVIALQPHTLFLPEQPPSADPSQGTIELEQPWSWREIAPAISRCATDQEDPFTFGHLFHQRLRADLTLRQGDLPIAETSFEAEIYDERRLGSLYQRILEKLIKPDTARQAQKAGCEIDHTYHPWYPVLSIGTEKADLYMKALHQDIVEKQRHLTDPRWLLRVGLYLELLTCLGIIEAVKEEVGDLLSPMERAIYEESPHFEKIRQAVDVDAWKEVWALRDIAFAKRSAPHELPVKLTHLLTKKKATLAFLKAHHEDLKWAIAFAGPNPHNAQETWHRVFRDAERAVLRKSLDAFPELNGFSPKIRDFVMWHQKGKLDLLLVKSVPKALSGLFGDQDGLYASACNQYRASMNEVAEWAKERGLMDYTGHECVPSEVSLLRAHMDQQHALVSLLQKRDGYAPSLDVLHSLPEEYRETQSLIAESLHHISLFGALSQEEREMLAAKARLIELGPMERITIQGQPGSSLFILFEGNLEVLVRQKDGHDIHVASLQKGAVFGEISFLTGAERSSTVRALEKATVIELHSNHLRPIIQSRPQLLEAFTTLMQTRLQEIEEHHHDYDEQKRPRLQRFAQRLRAYWLPS